jgi:hypothetical protein
LGLKGVNASCGAVQTNIHAMTPQIGPFTTEGAFQFSGAS